MNSDIYVLLKEVYEPNPCNICNKVAQEMIKTFKHAHDDDEALVSAWTLC